MIGHQLLLQRSVVDSLLTYALMVHPREGILLLRGRVEPHRITVCEVVIPPRAIHGVGFANFPVHMLPIDRAIIGTAHSHPSGTLSPSIPDLNHYYGRIMIITAYPYHSPHDIAAFNRDGDTVPYAVVDDDE
jgi:proteasome lid subunit RPN8/RPN11